MKKRIFILTLLVSIFSSAQIFAFGVKVDGDFGGKTSLCDLGVVFNNSKQTALFSTGICFGAIKAPVKEEITIDKGYLYGGTYTEKVVADKAFPVFGAFFDYTQRIPFLKKEKFDVGIDFGAGIRFNYGSNSNSAMFAVDLFPKVGASARFLGAILDLNYQFILRVGSTSSIDNAFNISCKYLFGSKGKSSKTVSSNSGSFIPSDNPRYIIVDPDVSF